jgi:hypothetical protein
VRLEECAVSQQINLLLPELRPRFDWLALPFVGAAVACILLLIVGMASFSAWQVNALKENEGALRVKLDGVQQQVLTLGQTLAARRGDPTLDNQLAAARTDIAQRQEVLNIIAQGDVSSGNAYSGLLQGFSRQAIEGVWLTGFGFAQRNIEIRGRLNDPALLPVYIGRLNAEPVFAGRRFAELDMKGIDPAEAKQGDTTLAAPLKKPSLPRYTEFVLRTEPEAVR